MEKFKVFGCLFLALISCFTLGIYATATLVLGETIELNRWILTTLFGLMFLIMFLIDYRKK